MPTAKELLASSITSGPASSIKAGSINLKTKAAKAKAVAHAESKKAEVPVGACKYRSPNLNFNLGNISFGGPYYTTSDPNELKMLDEAVARHLLYIEEDKRGS